MVLHGKPCGRVGRRRDLFSGMGLVPTNGPECFRVQAFLLFVRTSPRHPPGGRASTLGTSTRDCPNERLAAGCSSRVASLRCQQALLLQTVRGSEKRACGCRGVVSGLAAKTVGRQPTRLDRRQTSRGARLRRGTLRVRVLPSISPGIDASLESTTGGFAASS